MAMIFIYKASIQTNENMELLFLSTFEEPRRKCSDFHVSKPIYKDLKLNWQEYFLLQIRQFSTIGNACLAVKKITKDTFQSMVCYSVEFLKEKYK